MKLKTMCTIACCFLGSTVVLSGMAAAQQRTGGAFPQPAADKQVTVTEIPGVIAALGIANEFAHAPERLADTHGTAIPTSAMSRRR